MIDSFDAHEPWDAPRRLIDMYGDAEPARRGADPAVRHAGRRRSSELDLTQRLLRRMRQLYAAEVTMVDVWLGRFLDRLENLGLADNTLRGAGERPRRAARRARLGGQALLGDARGAHPRADGDAPPGRKGGGPDDAATSPRRTTSGPTVLSVLGVDEPRGMNGADLSPLFDGRQPRKKRSYRTAAYNTYVSASRRPLAPDRRQPPRGAAPLRPQAATAASATTSRTATRRRCARLWGKILHDAGGQLPHFPKTAARASGPGATEQRGSTLLDRDVLDLGLGGSRSRRSRYQSISERSVSRNSRIRLVS